MRLPVFLSVFISFSAHSMLRQATQLSRTSIKRRVPSSYLVPKKLCSSSTKHPLTLDTVAQIEALYKKKNRRLLIFTNGSLPLFSPVVFEVAPIFYESLQPQLSPVTALLITAATIGGPIGGIQAGGWWLLTRGCNKKITALKKELAGQNTAKVLDKKAHDLD